MDTQVDIDWEEASRYRHGLWVELKSNPGAFDMIACYEMDMVPPIWLVTDPRPRYAHELRVVHYSSVVCPLSVVCCPLLTA